MWRFDPAWQWVTHNRGKVAMAVVATVLFLECALYGAPLAGVGVAAALMGLCYWVEWVSHD